MDVGVHEKANKIKIIIGQQPDCALKLEYKQTHSLRHLLPFKDCPVEPGETPVVVGVELQPLIPSPDQEPKTDEWVNKDKIPLWCAAATGEGALATDNADGDSSTPRSTLHESPTLQLPLMIKIQ